jgi:hypothetical protein
LVDRGIDYFKRDADVNVSFVAQNFLMVKTAGRRFGRKKNYGLTVTVSSKPWCPALEFIFVLQSWTKHNLNDFAPTNISL